MYTDGQTNWPEISPPALLTPAASATVLAAVGFVITLNPFVSSSQTQSSSDYEIWTGSLGTGTLAWSATNDLGLVLKLVPAGALAAGSYFLRARFNSAIKSSAWSADRVVTVT